MAGGTFNRSGALRSAIGGGGYNYVTGVYGTIPGGYGDSIQSGFAMAAGYRTRLASPASYTFAFGENCTTRTARAVVFYHSGAPTKLGVGIQNPTWNADVAGTGRFSGKLQAGAGFKGDTAIADSEWVTRAYARSGAADNDWVHGGDSVLYTIRNLGIARGGANSALFGTARYTHVNLGVACTTGAAAYNDTFNTIAGGYQNVASGRRGYATVSGGLSNEACSTLATVGGGALNYARGNGAVIGGGAGNGALGYRSTIAGGQSNAATGQYSAVGGGEGNQAYGECAAIAGGSDNMVQSAASFATISGGYNNEVRGDYAAVGGGLGNIPNGLCATVAGGYNNRPTGNYAFVGGGVTNNPTGLLAAVGGGYGNSPSGVLTFIGGGDGNHALDSCGVVAGGRYDTAGGKYAGVLCGLGNRGGQFSRDSGAVVAGGMYNLACSTASIVGAGRLNRATGSYTFVGGGVGNTAGVLCAAVGGGSSNTASGTSATIPGGAFNTASAQSATVGGGEDNAATNVHATVGGGYYNEATGSRATVGGGYQNLASGFCATVPGGHGDTALGYYSFAAGRRARSANSGCFTWCDSNDSTLTNSTNNRWMARASGGVYFYTNRSATAGVYVPAGGGAWSSVSDRNKKCNFRAVDKRDLLEKLARIPIERWNYKSEPAGIDHIGPVSQDFMTAFGLGDNDQAISTIDADGIALAAIQALYAELKARDARLDALEAELAKLKQ